MVIIKGWKKVYDEKWIQYRHIKADPYYPQVNIYMGSLGISWNVQYASRTKLKEIGNNIRTKKEAIKIAINYMKTHPKG